MELLTAELLKKIRQIEIKTGKMVAETFAGEYLSVFKGQGMEFAEVREYMPGDDVRTIDWNVTARMRKPYVKRYVEERELTLIIACDISGSQHFGTGGKFKSETAAELAALFAFSAIKNNDKVGLVLFSDSIELSIPPKKGKKHILRVIRDLLAHQPKSPKTNIKASLDAVNRMYKRSGILILISDFMDFGYDRPFKLAAQKHDLIPVRITDPIESKLPALPVIIEAEDPETGQILTLDLSSAKLRSNINASHEKSKAHMEKLCTLTGVDWIDIDSSKPVVDPVIKFFKTREKKCR